MGICGHIYPERAITSLPHTQWEQGNSKTQQPLSLGLAFLFHDWVSKQFTQKMAITFNSILDFNSTKLQDKHNIGSRPFSGASMFKVNQFTSSAAFRSRSLIKSRRFGICLLSSNSDRLVTETSDTDSRDSAENLQVQDEPRAQSSEAYNESTLTSNQKETPSSANLQEKPRKSSLTARERLRAARVLSRYNETQAKTTSKTEMGSKVLDAIKESERGKKKGLPEAPGNLFDDSNRGVSKPGLSFEFPGGNDLFIIVFSFVFISTVMFATTYIVWKVGAIHFNEY